MAHCLLTFPTIPKPLPEASPSAAARVAGKCTGGNWNLRQVGYNGGHLHPPESGVRPMHEVTRILCAIEQGDPQAAEQLLPLVYD